MKLTRLALTDFRNYTHTVWSPDASILVLTGENGSGKTNLLEAVSLLAPGRGLRGAALPALCRTGAERWGVAATLQSGLDEFRIGTGSDLTEKQRRTFRLDGENIRSQAAISQKFSCVWLTPQMDRLFQEGSSGRRRFLDRLVMALSPDHGRQIAAHDRSVASRNRVLSERPTEAAWLSSIEDSIGRHAVAASAARLALIESMNAHPFENTGFSASTLHLDCAIASRLATQPALDVEDWIRSSLQQARAEDRQRSTTSIGAHRADFTLSDTATGRTAELSSSGQQKIMLTGTILSHARLMTQERGQAPAILLDEPLLHLDETRRRALLESLEGLRAPILITGTDAEAFAPIAGRAQFFSVRDGTISPS
ncbi:DNA replication/repair protein RecF [Gluconobacter sp. Dm-62]|uniref:DNA replication/repair protein RecF n=1 Tax=Gluconobacter sp. Dm-62 TaxID=2799804 RepID=UPI001B8BC066|nr:DNA replication/repair protein RecF [Gluconobacter sp. Dm-62]MBS1101953.1 DNA replication/repair protein RecF [Gluconobacter sp. Dm-62]